MFISAADKLIRVTHPIITSCQFLLEDDYWATRGALSLEPSSDHSGRNSNRRKLREWLLGILLVKDPFLLDVQHLPMLIDLRST